MAGDSHRPELTTDKNGAKPEGPVFLSDGPGAQEAGGAASVRASSTRASCVSVPPKTEGTPQRQGDRPPATDHMTLPPGPHAADSALCLSGGNRGAGIDFHTLLNSLVVTADSDHGARQRHRFQGSTGRHRPDRRDSTPRGPTRPRRSPGHSTVNTGPAVRHAGRVDEATRSLATVRVEVPRHTPGPHRLRPEGPYVTGPSGERRGVVCHPHFWQLSEICSQDTGRPCVPNAVS